MVKTMLWENRTCYQVKLQCLLFSKIHPKQVCIPLKRQSQQLSFALSSAGYFKSHCCKQCGPRSDFSFRSSLIWVHTVCLYAKCKFEKFARRCSRRHKQTTFSDVDFLGALRVKNRSKLLYCCFSKLHFGECFISKLGSMPAFLWVKVAKKLLNSLLVSNIVTGQSNYPWTLEDIPVHLFCDTIHVHQRWHAHPRVSVILDHALLHSWFKQKIETLARKQDPDFLSQNFSKGFC